MRGRLWRRSRGFATGAEEGTARSFGEEEGGNPIGTMLEEKEEIPAKRQHTPAATTQCIAYIGTVEASVTTMYTKRSQSPSLVGRLGLGRELRQFPTAANCPR